MGGGRERARVADVDQDAGAGPGADAGHGGEDLRERVFVEQFLDPLLQDLALVEDGPQ